MGIKSTPQSLFRVFAFLLVRKMTSCFLHPTDFLPLPVPLRVQNPNQWVTVSISELLSLPPLDSLRILLLLHRHSFLPLCATVKHPIFPTEGVFYSPVISQLLRCILQYCRHCEPKNPIYFVLLHSVEPHSSQSITFESIIELEGKVFVWTIE